MNLEENFQKIKSIILNIVPKAMLLVYPVFAGIAYLISYQETLESELFPEFSDEFSQEPNYIVFAGAFIFIFLIWIVFQKFVRPTLEKRIKERNSLSANAELQILDIGIISQLAVFGVVYSLLFGWYPENLLFFIVPFLLHIRYLQISSK